MQIVGNREMPLEAVFDAFTPSFVRRELSKQNLTELPETEETIDGAVCILGNVFSRNFTHCHEEMMKVIILETMGYECRYVLAESPGFAKELLGLLGIAPDRISRFGGRLVFGRHFSRRRSAIVTLRNIPRCCSR